MSIFDKNEIITCHDNLLASLYNLDATTIYYKEINDEYYLINSINGKGYEIGLRVKVDKLNYPQDVKLLSLYDENSYELTEVKMILGMYSKYLMFSNCEKYITNILLDKYLSNEYDFDISIKEIESRYRKKAISYRNITLNTSTYNRYVSTIYSLLCKEIFLKTSKSFRDSRYGVNSINLYQKLLIVDSYYNSGINNITFTYSFGGFGKVIKQSKRFSNLVPGGYYRINFNQLKLHLVAFYIARDIFIQQGIINKYPYVERNYYLEVDIDRIISLVEEKNLEQKKCNKARNYKNIVKYIESVLGSLEANHYIEKYSEEFMYEETEHFMKKHEFDYDIDNALKDYKFTIDDLDEDVSVRFTIIMPGISKAMLYNFY